jgi:hypothetical protein
MVRPKGSKENIRAALAFAEISLIRGEQPNQPTHSLVPFKGPGSIFAIFCECLPELARIPGENHSENRRGVSSVELNKSLPIIGLRTERKISHSGGYCKVIVPQIIVENQQYHR